jgi:hypothetical protein
MKKILVMALAVALVAGVNSTANAHIGGLVFPVFELPTSDLPDLNDGTLEDWEDVLPATDLTHDDFAPLNVADGAGINPEDLAYRIFWAWHSAGQHLYFAIERVDNVYINKYEGGDLTSLWRHDSVEVMVDGDHTAGSYNGFSAEDFSEEEIKLLKNFQAQQYVAVAESPDGNSLGYQGNGQGWANSPPWADGGGFNDGAENPNTSVIELYLTAWDEHNWEGPELSKRSDLTAGKIIGFQISVPDFDLDCNGCGDFGTDEDGNTITAGYHGFHTLSGQPNTWREADNFVDGELIGCDTGDCGNAPTNTAVEDDSWGRIKASFR